METHNQEYCCSRCDQKGRDIVTFTCAVCLSFAVGTMELDFGKIVKKGHPVNDFSTDAVQFVLTSTNTSVAVSGDMMINFANVQKIEQPKAIDYPRINIQPL